jgi:hypothetical protein
MRDDSTSHEIDQHWSNAGLHDMAPEHHDDSPATHMCVDDCFDNRAKIRSDENVRKSLDECRERAVLAGRCRELFCADFVWTALYWNRLYLRKISLRSRV